MSSNDRPAMAESTLVRGTDMLEVDQRGEVEDGRRRERRERREERRGGGGGGKKRGWQVTKSWSHARPALSSVLPLPRPLPHYFPFTSPSSTTYCMSIFIHFISSHLIPSFHYSFITIHPSIISSIYLTRALTSAASVDAPRICSTRLYLAR